MLHCQISDYVLICWALSNQKFWFHPVLDVVNYMCPSAKTFIFADSSIPSTTHLFIKCNITTILCDQAMLIIKNYDHKIYTFQLIIQRLSNNNWENFENTRFSRFSNYFMYLHNIYYFFLNKLYIDIKVPITFLVK